MTFTMTKPPQAEIRRQILSPIFYPDNYRDSGGIKSTGHIANRETLWATLPRKISLIKPFP